MVGHTLGSTVAVRPLKGSVITDFDITAIVLKHFIKEATKSDMFGRPYTVVCISSGAAGVERHAVEDVAH